MILFFRHPKCPEVREKRRGVLGKHLRVSCLLCMGPPDTCLYSEKPAPQISVTPPVVTVTAQL